MRNVSIAGREACGGCRWEGKTDTGKAGYSLLFAYSHDDVQRAVEEETALLGERRYRERKDGSREELLGEIVMDGEYDNLFRRYFDEACGAVVQAIPRKVIRHTVTDLHPPVIEGQNVDKDRDFFLELVLPTDFPVQYRGGVNALIGGFLVDYICGRWLETKVAEEGVKYLERADGRQEQLKKMLMGAWGEVRRAPSWP